MLVKEGADGRLRIVVGGQVVREYVLAEQAGQVITTPDHAAAVRLLARRRPAPVDVAPSLPPLRWPEVEVRPLAVYDRAVGLDAPAAGGVEWTP